ncbi:MAG: hypothetical protein FJ109_20670, partial [Deltaproteobacteria bacterium]|nr:hypothetical protein [Deltaproteobacteria bacterium]
MRFSIALFLGAALLGLSLPTCHGGGGQERVEREGLARLTQRYRLYDVQYVGDHVFAVGFPGLILHSGDRGATFEFQEGGLGEALLAVDFVDEANGFIVGRDGLLLSTTDGGKKWDLLPTGVKEPLFDLDFVDSRNGWLVGNFGLILHTSDGGKTFERQTVKEEEDEGDSGSAVDSPGSAADSGSASGG